MREELERIFGSVSTDVEPHASDCTENPPRRPAFVVEATREEQVGALLRLASARGVPVTPKATGQNVAGLAIPAEGGIVLDLRRLDAIEVDAENMVAWIGPGVSWQRLKEEAGRRGLVVGFPLAPPDASVLACALMDGLSTMALAHGSFGDWVHGVVAYLADGTRVVTGSAAVSGRPLSRGPLPDLTGLFLNWFGATGVVVRLGLALWPKRAHRHRDVVACPSVEAAVRLLRAGGRTGLFDDLGGLSWPAAKWALGVERLGARDPAEPEVYVVADYAADDARDLALRARRLRALARDAGAEAPVPVEDLLRLAPGLEAFSELPVRLGFLVDHAGGGLSWVGTYGPAEKLVEGAGTGMRVLEAAGHPPLLVTRPMKGGHFAVLRFIERFDRRDPAAVERVRATNVALARALLDLGFVPYKCPGVLLDEVLPRMDPGFRDLMLRVKRLMDPAGILNPERWRLG